MTHSNPFDRRTWSVRPARVVVTALLAAGVLAGCTPPTVGVLAVARSADGGLQAVLHPCSEGASANRISTVDNTPDVDDYEISFEAAKADKIVDLEGFESYLATLHGEVVYVFGWDSAEKGNFEGPQAEVGAFLGLKPGQLLDYGAEGVRISDLTPAEWLSRPDICD